MSDESAMIEDDDELLSEAEKEALMDGVSSGVIGEASSDDGPAQCTPFVIRPDAHINFGSFPRLQAICQEMAKRLAAEWTQLLRTRVRVQAREAFSTNYASATARLQAPVITTTLAMDPLPGNAVAVLDNALLAALVEGFFGFVSDDKENVYNSGPLVRGQFTAGELRVTELALSRFIGTIAPSWERLIALKPAARSREFDPSLGVGISAKDGVLACLFDVTTEARQGRLHLILPKSQIASIADDLEGASNARNQAGDPHWRACLQQQLAETEVAVEITVGGIEMPLRRVVALKAGDVLPLEAPELARMSVQGEARAVGRFGTHDNHNAFRLAQWLPASR